MNNRKMNWCEHVEILSKYDDWQCYKVINLQVAHMEINSVAV